MRKITAGLFHSIDGVVQDPFNFQFDSFDDDLGALLTGVQQRTDAVVMGRKGWQDWAGYWPKATQDTDFADYINAVPKYVASRSKTQADLGAWSNSHHIAGDPVAFLRDLKAQPGGEIAVMGGIEIVRSLFLAGVLDELSLITHPVIAGGGRHLFEPTDPTTRLDLVDVTRTQKGNLVQVYRLKAA